MFSPAHAAAAHIVSFDALERARTTLDDFTRFYIALHGRPRDDFFKFLPVLTFVEACIYQMDEENEAYTCRLAKLPPVASSASSSAAVASHASSSTSADIATHDHHPTMINMSAHDWEHAHPPPPPPDWSATPTGAALRGVLAARGLLSAQVLEGLAEGESYWQQERTLCGAMAACAPVDVAAVHACSGLKSFDYRVLHALLGQLLAGAASRKGKGKTAAAAYAPDAQLLGFLRVDETLTDLADDLVDYEKDVRKNSFNVLRGVVHALGAEAAPLALAARIGELEKEHARLLRALPPAPRSAFEECRRRALSRTPSSGKWIFPRVVAPAEEAAVRASFSWGKRKKKQMQDRMQQQPAPIHDGARIVMLERAQADGEIGFEMHEVTGDVLVSYVSDALAAEVGMEMGETLLAIQGVQLVDGGPDAVEGARYILREPCPSNQVELILQRHVVRTEVLKRHAALRGTSLDKLGLTLAAAGDHVVIMDTDGLAAKTKRFAINDKLIAINGTRIVGIDSAVSLLKHASEEGDETVIEMIYGYAPPENHEFEPESGLYIPRREEVKSGGAAGFGQAVRRSLSFGKKKKPARDGKSGSSADDARRPSKSELPIPELNLEPRLLDIPKNDAGMIQVTFKAHAVTNELIIGLVGEGSPAQLAGVEVGDAVLALQGNMIESDGEFALDDARAILQQTAHFRTVELMVQTRVRTETLEFAQKEPGAPRNHLGMAFYSFPDDTAVRVTGVSGPAQKAGRIALGDRIVAVNGIRVNHAQTLSDHVAHLARTLDAITFEVALGYAAGEGVWYGQESEQKPGEGERKVKRSFSFGRKPRH